MRPPTSPTGAVPRRPLLVSVALVVPLSACDVLSGADDETDDTAAPTREADEQLVEQTIALERRLTELLQPLTTSGPPARRRIARASQRIHLDHLALLGAPVELSGPADRLTPPQRLRRQVALVAAQERASRRHREAAVQAASGQLARVLASMSAAGAQQALVWRGVR